MDGSGKPSGHEPLRQATLTLNDDVLAYVAKAVGDIAAASRMVAQGSHSPCSQQASAEQIFSLLTHRDFCYLSKSRVVPYRAAALAHFADAIARSAPISLNLALGGGYHASLVPENGALVFEPGLGELLALRQVALFAERLATIYAPGVRFALVIDNLCALALNDIPTDQTEAYCVRLQAMIDALELGSVVRLLVESRHFDAAAYLAATRLDGPLLPLSVEDHRNVERFLGRACDAVEATHRHHCYGPVAACSARLVGGAIQGIRLTQRASPATLCFRSFPGSDCRIQAGEVALSPRPDGSLKPFLLTTANIDGALCSIVDTSRATFGQVPHVWLAHPLPVSLAQTAVAQSGGDLADKRDAA